MHTNDKQQHWAVWCVIAARNLLVGRRECSVRWCYLITRCRCFAGCSCMWRNTMPVHRLKPNTHHRRRRDSTVELSRVGVGGVYWALRYIFDDADSRHEHSQACCLPLLHVIQSWNTATLSGIHFKFNTASFHTFYSTHSPEICVKLGLIFAAIETQVWWASLQDSSPQSLEHPLT